MTTEPGGEAAAVETTPKAAPEAALSSQASERDWEAEAEAYGWVPQDQFKGDLDKWRPAEEFVRRGEEILPIVRKQNEKLHTKVAELEETNKRMSAMFEKTTARIKAEYEGKIEALKADKKAAIKEGDADKVEQIERQIDTLKEESAEEVADTKKAIKGWDDYPDDFQPKNGSPEHDALTQAFYAAHDWMVDEPEMAKFAEDWNARNSQRNPDIGFKANVKATVEAVRKRFPEYFKDSKDTTAANGHAAVDAGGNFPGAQQAKGPSSKLNQTELAQARKDVQAGLYKNTDEWAKAYFA